MLKLKLKTCPQLQLIEDCERVLHISEYGAGSLVILLMRVVLMTIAGERTLSERELWSSWLF